MNKIKDFLSYKKNRRIVIIAAIAIVTTVAIVLSITITGVNTSASDKGQDNKSEETLDVNPNTMVLTDESGNVVLGDDGKPITIAADGTISGGVVSGSGQAVVGAQGGVSTGSADWNVNTWADSTGGNVSSGGNAASSGSAAGGSQGIPQGGSASEQSQTPVSVACNITIDCSSISGNGALTAAGYPQLEGYAAYPTILSTSINATDSNGDGRVGVDEAIKQACDANGIQYEFKGASYVRGINYLYEFNAGPNSGWMYRVNGRTPNKGCNLYYLNGSEDIVWYYVISY